MDDPSPTGGADSAPRDPADGPRMFRPEVPLRLLLIAVAFFWAYIAYALFSNGAEVIVGIVLGALIALHLACALLPRVHLSTFLMAPALDLLLVVSVLVAFSGASLG